MHRGYRPSFAGWSISLCASTTYSTDLSTCWREVIALADREDHDGAHIVGFHKTASKRKTFEAAVWGRHRLIWVELSALRFYGTEQFTSLLESIVEFEEEWRAIVRPQDIRSPLILPETAFGADKSVQALWERAQTLRLHNDTAVSVAALAERFRNQHYKQGCWVDTEDRRFAIDADFHGLHVDSELLWKYTFRLPLGFHFHVTREKRRGFRVRDRSGEMRTFRTYTNVDAHGNILRGS